MTTSNIQVDPTQVHTSLLEIAENRAEKSAVQALKYIFEGAIEIIEKYEEIKIDAEIKKRIWKYISPDSIASLKKFILFELSSKNQMNPDKTGSILSESNTSNLLINEATMLTSDWGKKILRSLENEGISITKFEIHPIT
ncbi:MAG: hypothetical protein VX777_07160 [Chlamydiota bacterium]|nr:hypothetical protein [Chlamydiota bacterium]